MKTVDGEIPDDVMRRREQERIRKRRERARLARGERFEKVRLRDDEFCIVLPVSLIDVLVRRGLKECDAANLPKVARKIVACLVTRDFTGGFNRADDADDSASREPSK